MAANVSQADSNMETNNVLIYIMPQRIQKSMLQDIKNAVKKTSLQTCEKFRDSVSHIVTQYTEQEQVLRQLKRDGVISNDSSLDGMKIVSLPWLSACLKAGKPVAIESKHVVKSCSVTQQGQENATTTAQDQGRAQLPVVPLWACQRATPLTHFNQKFTDALEILEKHAEFRNETSDYPRALAFRRASCVLKSLPFRVERLNQVKGLKDVGGHALKVIQSILEEGTCDEVEKITDRWFELMKEFTSVFGVGPATAKKWIERGWQSVEEVRKSDDFRRDERVMWGLAFHEDLTSPVSVKEANAFVNIVKKTATEILPGVIVTLTGGFRRGKKSGHDVDILLTHPTVGEEIGLLTTLLHSLERKGLVLMGRLESSTFTQDSLQSDSKLNALRGQLDHFEKWLGICKFETANNDNDSLNTSEGSLPLKGSKTGDGAGAANSAEESLSSDLPAKTDKAENSALRGYSVAQKNMQDIETQSAEIKPKQKSDSKSDSNTDSKPETNDESQLEPRLKRQKTGNEVLSLMELARSRRSWKACRVDLIVTPYSQYYYALVGWTGNKHFNRDLRLYSQKELNMKLSSHGLWDFQKGRAVPAESEEEVFKNLKLVYRQPFDRNC